MIRNSGEPQELAKAFFKSVQDVQPNADILIDSLRKGNLGQLTGLGDLFFQSLNLASERALAAPDNRTALKNMALALRAVLQFGVAWTPPLLQDKGFQALTAARQVSVELQHSVLAHGALHALTHLAPLLETEQNEQITRLDGSLSGQATNSSDASSLDELMFASPRQILFRESNFQALGEAGATLSAAARIIGGLRDVLSDPSTGDGLKAGELLIWARQSIHSVCLIIPELARVSDVTEYAYLNDSIFNVVDALTWIILASNRIDGIAGGRIPTGEPLQKQIAWSDQLLEIRDISWLALALILDPAGPWARRYAGECRELQERAMDRISQDSQRGHYRAGRFPMEVFLATTDNGHGYEGFQADDLRGSVFGYLGQFGPDNGFPPIYADGLAAAATAWIEQNKDVGDDVHYPEQLRDAALKALKGRAFNLDAQAFLIRAR